MIWLKVKHIRIRYEMRETRKKLLEIGVYGWKSFKLAFDGSNLDGFSFLPAKISYFQLVLSFCPIRF